MNWLYKLYDHRAQMMREHAWEIQVLDQAIAMIYSKMPRTLAIFDQTFHDRQLRLSHGKDSSTVKTSNQNLEG